VAVLVTLELEAVKKMHDGSIKPKEDIFNTNISVLCSGLYPTANIR
jgi:hypothetical protein